ncbi:RNase RNM [Thalassotalea atypica]|uniref:RNase RNM n=1 Tax=Thalassotalea atypica TaxID=2054316 RepID=UPI00257244AA|nr:PHP domain-containing protein [Thalassotalea atypica]
MSTAVSDNINQKQTNKRFDLHSHTNLSDGKLSPKELIDRAENFQLDVLAITDHDTTAALDIANRYISETNKKIELVNGIEFSTSWRNFEIHIVGLNIDPDNESLQSLISNQQNAREQRAIAMGEKLAKCGFDNMLEKAKLLAGEGSITRAHFAQVLLNEGAVPKMQAAFDKYIGKGKRAFVKPTWCDISNAVDAIHQAGGVAVMAHPMRYDMTAKWLKRLLSDFKAAGGDGMEIVLPQMNPEQRRLMLSYCLEYELYASLGSDFHYPSKWSDLGRNLTLPDSCKPVWQLWQS